MKRIIFIIYMLICIILVSCSKSTINYDGNIELYDTKLFKNAEIIVPKNQTNAQSLSIVVKNCNNDLIIFDGGRIEDSEYLASIIRNNGGKVRAWFLTHIHDDHIGALYKILSDEAFSDIEIESLYFKFADFEWYYKHIGNDAGALPLFLDAVDNKKDINIYDNISKNDIYDFINVKVQVLNNIYLLNQDPINNTSISYKVYIDNKSMIIFGDLGYNGGEKLYTEMEDKAIIKSNIVVLSHHGQNGIPVGLYKYVDPEIVIWPSSKDIYDNANDKYNTSETKDMLSMLNIKKHILSFNCTTIIK